MIYGGDAIRFVDDEFTEFTEFSYLKLLQSRSGNCPPACANAVAAAITATSDSLPRYSRPYLRVEIKRVIERMNECV